MLWCVEYIHNLPIFYTLIPLILQVYELLPYLKVAIFAIFTKLNIKLYVVMLSFNVIIALSWFLERKSAFLHPGAGPGYFRGVSEQQ